MTDEQQLHQSLSQHFGFSTFRTGQEQTIRQLVNGFSSLAIFPTGSGKSLCYQLSALHLPNLTIVISPLLALMQDQIDFLQRKGIPAASLDSTQSRSQSQAVMQGIRRGEIKILMVSVERFKNERFREFIKQIPISMMVVDEAHCISEWGHNFRPDYLKLPAYRKALNIPLVLLLTATATKKVKMDMAGKFDIASEHIVQTGFYRKNLDINVVALNEDEKLNYLIREIKGYSGAGIVYVTLQQQADQVAKQLQASGVQAAGYHAGLADDLRQQIQAQFMRGELQVVVATIAFGMGVDKSDIRFVMHYDLPKSIENYSQEIGRAGRDGDAALCTVLANLDGLATVENFVYGDTPELTGVQSVLNTIEQDQQNGQWDMQELTLSKSSNIRILALKTLLVQLEIQGVITAQYAYYADFRIKLLHSEKKIISKFDPKRQMFLQQIFTATQFKKVWGTVDMTSLVSQAADRERVVAALDYLNEQGLIELESKRVMQVYSVNTDRLSNSDLAQQLYGYFKSKEQSELKRIASMIRFFELDRCLSRNLSNYFDDMAVPDSCGHCSVCHGKVAKLVESTHRRLPNDELLREHIFGLQKHLANASTSASGDTILRFLTGVTTPLFTKYKLKQLPGFGSCEGHRYAAVNAKIKQLGLWVD